MKQIIALLFGLAAVGAIAEEKSVTQTNAVPLEKATFGGGCFWCVEAVFEQIPGVKKVTSGYAGGRTANPTYKEVCAGDSGHAEVIEVEYDPAVASFSQMLDVFWNSHDPTQLNRQGNDVGTQYRSVIFYHGEAQKKLAEAAKERLDKSGKYGDPIVTEIVPAAPFYPVEDYHQGYYQRNRNQPYCQAVIRPKLKKLGLPP